MLFWHKRKKGQKAIVVKSAPRPQKRILTIEILEDRTMLSWSPLGPLTQTGWPASNSIFADAVAGRTTSLAYDRNFDGMNHDQIIQGTAGGGVWIFNETLNPQAWRSAFGAAFKDWNGNLITDPLLLAGTEAIGAVAVDPNNPKVIYAATGEGNYSADSRWGSGILKSTDAGVNWVLATGRAPGGNDFQRQAFSSIFVDPINSNYVYAAMVPAAEGGAYQTDAAYRNADGIYESNDAGKDWRQIFGPGINGGVPNPFIVTSMDFTVVGGQVNIIAGVSNPDSFPFATDAKVGYENGKGKGIWVGSFAVNAGGRNWNFNEVRPEPKSRRIALTANEGHGPNPTIYAAVADQTGAIASVLKSTNNGAAWDDKLLPEAAQRRDLSPDKIGWYALTIAMDVNNPNVVYLASQGDFPIDAGYKGGGIIYTTDGGKTWKAADGPPVGGAFNPQAPRGFYTRPHPDHHALLVISDQRGTRVYDGTDGGVFRLNPKSRVNPWQDWNNANGGAGPDTNMVNAVGVPTGPIANVANVKVWEGSQDDGIASRTGTAGEIPWKTADQAPNKPLKFIYTNEALAGDAGMVRVTPDGNVTYMVTNSDKGRLVMWGLNSDITDQWQRISPAGAIATDKSFPFYPVFAISSTPHPVTLEGKPTFRYLVAVGSPDNIWQREIVPAKNPKDNATFQWRSLNPPKGPLDPGQAPTAITYQSDNALYVGYADGKVFKYDGKGWPQLAPGAGAGWGSGQIQSIAVDSSTSDVYVAIRTFTAGQQVWRYSTVMGKGAWQNLSGAGAGQIPPVPANTLQVYHKPDGSTVLLAGNDAGVYWTYAPADTTKVSWARLDTGLPYVQVTDLQRVGTTYQFLAGTHGRGVWNIDLTPKKAQLNTTPGATVIVGSGTYLVDSATLSGGDDPTGSLTFQLYQGDTVVDTEQVTVNGDGTYTTPNGYLPTSTGTYQWVVAYSGDVINDRVLSPFGSEPETVVAASPTASTKPNVTTVTLGTSPVTLTDTAQLQGGYQPGGTITFTLYRGGILVDTEQETVNGNGTYTTPTGYALPTDGSAAAGAYQWDTRYSGDPNNNAASDVDNPGEQVTVNPAGPTLLTTTGDGGTVGSTPLQDTAQLSGGYYPTGSILFTLTGPTGFTPYTQTVAVNGNGTYTANAGLATLPGTYTWTAVYSGDANNQAAVEPNQAGNGSLTLNGLTSYSFTGIVTANDGQGNSIRVDAYLGQMAVTFTDRSGNRSTFYTFCIDPVHEVSIGQTYPGTVQNSLAPAFDNAAEMAFLYQTYGMQNLAGDPQTAAALALAEMDLALNNQPTPTAFTADGHGGYSSGSPTVFDVSGISSTLAGQVNRLLGEAVAADASMQGAWVEAIATGLARGQNVLLPGETIEVSPASPAAS